MAFPCVGSEGPVGAFAFSRPGSPITLIEREFAETLAGHVALALQKALVVLELIRMATTDALTGLSNRRHFLAQAERVVSEWKRHSGALSLIILDIDHFKRFNDSYGHDVGDRVLAQVARSLRTTLRKEDLLARFGGEEFVVLLPRIALHEAHFGTAERLRAHVEATPLETSEGPVKITVSLGVAGFSLEAPSTLLGVLKRADEGLYEAKARGRIRSVALDLAEA